MRRVRSSWGMGKAGWRMETLGLAVEAGRVAAREDAARKAATVVAKVAKGESGMVKVRLAMSWPAEVVSTVCQEPRVNLNSSVVLGGRARTVVRVGPVPWRGNLPGF